MFAYGHGGHRGSVDQAREVAQSARRQAATVDRRVQELEDEVGRLTLIAEALWTFVWTRASSSELSRATE